MTALIRFTFGPGLALLLASCAPTISAPQLGRIVNSQTGAEGSVTLTRGTLRPMLADPFAPDNVRIEIGGVVYSGRTQVVGRSSTLGAEWGVRLGGGQTSTGAGAAVRDPFFWDTRIDSPRNDGASYSGNLIARSAGPAVKTLTCTLLIDTREHGIGECTGNDGVKYALQF